MRIVAISDTHGRHDQMLHPVPDGDVLVVAGDFTRHGQLEQVRDFNYWLKILPHKHKLAVGGNHNKDFYENRAEAELILTEAIYLEDGEIVIDGVKFYGSPWTPNYYDWSFMLPRQSKEISQKWAKIPEDTDVLITHGPPYHILDKARDDKKAGCEALARRVEELNLKAHIFGHVHEGHGKSGIYHNVAICNIEYEPVNPPTVIDLG